MNRDKEAILDIIESINKIFAYTRNVTLEDFCSNDEKQDAVLRRLLIIGVLWKITCHS